MKNFKLRKLLTIMAVTFIAAVTISPKAYAAWKQADNGNWSYTEDSGSVSGWKLINGSWYFFDSNSIMKTGWVLDGNTWYYLAPSGEMKTGWILNDNKWYYTSSSGALKTGWILDGEKWYYTASSGAMQTGWIQNNGVWYYLNSSGAMQTGLVDVSGKTYYLSESGAMKTGNVTVNGVNYTFAASGEKVNSSAVNTTETTTTASGGSGSSSGTGSSGTSTNASSYKDLYGTWEVGNCVSKNGKLTDEQIALCQGKQLTLQDSTVYYGNIAVPATSINEGTISSSDFTNKYNVEISNDKVSSVSTTLNYSGLSTSVTIYTAKNKSNEDVHYALLKGTLFELNKQ